MDCSIKIIFLFIFHNNDLFWVLHFQFSTFVIYANYQGVSITQKMPTLFFRFTVGFLLQTVWLKEKHFIHWFNIVPLSLYIFIPSYQEMFNYLSQQSYVERTDKSFCYYIRYEVVKFETIRKSLGRVLTFETIISYFFLNGIIPKYGIYVLCNICCNFMWINTMEK